MRFIADTSVALAWVVASQADALTAAAEITARREGVLVPFHFHLELANALLMLERRGRLEAGGLETAISGFDLISIETDTEPIAMVAHTILPLARTHRLTLYDAAYLELALRTQLPLATRDLAAATEAAGAAIFPPNNP